MDAVWIMKVTAGSVVERSTKNSSVSSKNMSLMSSIISQMMGSEFIGSNVMTAVSGMKSTLPVSELKLVKFLIDIYVLRRECVYLLMVRKIDR